MPMTHENGLYYTNSEWCRGKIYPRKLSGLRKGERYGNWLQLPFDRLRAAFWGKVL
jgi:hypothetical protein